MLVGRADDERRIAELLADDRPVVVSGEAGIGKTTLLHQVAAARDRPVFAGGALATLSWMAYLPLRRALGRDVAAGDPTAVAADVEAAIGDAVLVVDDVQWADVGTLDVLTLLAGRVGLLAGVRRGDPGADAVLDRLGAAGFTELALRPLAVDDSRALVRSLRPDLSAATVERLIARTHGNPLLLRELSASGEPTSSLRLALAAQLRNLDDLAREMFGLLALAGRPIRADALDEAGVKSLVATELAVRSGQDIAVRHALLAEVAVEHMAADERQALHARLALAVADPGEAAYHHERAGETALAHDAALRAAEATNRPAEQARHLALAAATASGPEADALRLRAALALEQAHDWAAMIAILALLDPDDAQLQAHAHLLRARGAWVAGNAEVVRNSLEAGLALVAGTGTDVEVRLQIEHGRIPMFLDNDPDTAVRESSAALALARETGVDLPRARYLYGTALYCADLPGVDENLRAAIADARACGDTSTEFLAANNLISHHESGGDPAVARELCREVIARAHSLGLGEWEHSFRVVRAALDFHAGEYAQVEAEAEAMLPVLQEARGIDQLIEALCLSLIDVGRIDEALRRIEDVRADDYRGEMQRLLVRMEGALWGGRPAAAAALAEHYLTFPDSDPNTVLGHVTRAWALFDLGRDPGDPPGPQARPMLQSIPVEIEGLRTLHVGRHVRAEALLARAAQMWAPWHKRGELRCRWAAAEAVRRAGDTARAVSLLERVEAEAEARGMLPLLGRVHQSLRSAGQRRSAPRTRDAGSTLTGRQAELLALVRQGLTNAEIAGRLGISRHTVVAQLASATAKLGASSRAQAAVLAGQAG